MKGGEMEDVAGDFCQSRFFGITVRGMGEEEGFVREGDELYILTSSSHIGPVLKSTVAK
jgi:hypothetical protein